MPDSIINLLKGDSVGSETDYRDALPTNMYGVASPLFGADGYMIQDQGLTEFANGNSGTCRGGVWNERIGAHFRVIGNQFIEIDNLGNVTVLGSVSGFDTVSMPYSFNTQAIIAGGNYYLYDRTNGFRQVNDSDVGRPIDATWVDGYYFFTDGANLYHSNLTNESEIDPLTFATSEYSPDPTVGLELTQDNKVAAFNRYTTEFFQNVASTNFAFSRIIQRTIKSGIVGTHCKAAFGDLFFTLGGNKGETVGAHIMTVGGTSRISTREVDKIINAYTETQLADSVVEAYQEDGYTFALYHLPNETLKFNYTLANQGAASQAWSIMQTGTSQNYRGIHLVNVPPLNRWTLGDKRDARIGTLDNSVATQYGEVAEWILYTPFYYIEQASVDKLEIETITGFSGSDDATVFVSTTMNGITYSREWTQVYGRKFDYGMRFIVRRMGYVRDWIGFRFRGATRSRMAFARGFISYG